MSTLNLSTTRRLSQLHRRLKDRTEIHKIIVALLRFAVDAGLAGAAERVRLVVQDHGVLTLTIIGDSLPVDGDGHIRSRPKDVLTRLLMGMPPEPLYGPAHPQARRFYLHYQRLDPNTASIVAENSADGGVWRVAIFAGNVPRPLQMIRALRPGEKPFLSIRVNVDASLFSTTLVHQRWLSETCQRYSMLMPNLPLDVVDQRHHEQHMATFALDAAGAARLQLQSMGIDMPVHQRHIWLTVDHYGSADAAQFDTRLQLSLAIVDDTDPGDLVIRGMRNLQSLAANHADMIQLIEGGLALVLRRFHTDDRTQSDVLNTVLRRVRAHALIWQAVDGSRQYLARTALSRPFIIAAQQALYEHIMSRLPHSEALQHALGIPMQVRVAP